ncbi:MAG: type IV secretion system DNA-binding domain-containing protein [Patescibacteria group bacterium]
MYNPERVTYFAATDSRGKRVPFGIKTKDRSKHMYVIGKTGMGKSTLLENMAIQDIRNGEGLTFIDPHGGTADKLLEYIPESRGKDVVYFAPVDLARPIAFNVMEDVGYDKRHLVVSGLMATFKKIWEDAWSARMEYILTNTLLALLEYPDATLLGVNRMYTDKGYRKKVIENVKDPVVKDFWTKEFANYGERYTQEATPAIQNKIGQFTGNPLIRNIIGQPKSSFDIREMMDTRKILIINLSKGLVGETNMRLLGSMLTTRIFLAAMSRAEFSQEKLHSLPNFYLYVDEFQNFANETFAEILSEARKYNLNLIIAHQYIEQMEEEVRDAVFGNVGTTVTFRVGPFDAEVLETVFTPEFLAEDIVNLGLRQIYLSLMIDGIGSRPFSATTIPPIEAPARTFKQEVIEASRQQYGAQREEIEVSVREALVTEEGDEEPPAPSQRPQYGARPRPDRAPLPRAQSGGDRARPQRTDAPPSERRSADAPRQERSMPRADRPAPREQQALPKEKTAEDLKAILRSTIAKAEGEKGAKVVQKDKGLHDALSTVAKLPPPPPVTQAPRIVQGGNERQPDKRPFEVPEDTLRSIFKEDV